MVPEPANPLEKAFESVEPGGVTMFTDARKISGALGEKPLPFRRARHSGQHSLEVFKERFRFGNGNEAVMTEV